MSIGNFFLLLTCSFSSRTTPVPAQTASTEHATQSQSAQQKVSASMKPAIQNQCAQVKVSSSTKPDIQSLECTGKG